MTSARINRGGGHHDPLSSGSTNSLTGSQDASIIIPVITPDLLAYLDRMFPDRLDLVTRMGTMDRARGARDVIDHLRQLHTDQQEE